MSSRAPNFLRAAFLLPANLVGLLTAGVSSALTENPLPALVALGVEGVYLGVVSSSRRFQRAVRARHPDEAEEGRAQVAALLAELAPSQREHYQQLVALRERILDNYRKLPGGRVLAASSEARLDALLTQFLRLLGALNQYRTFLNAADRAQVERELTGLTAELGAADAGGRAAEVKRKRVDILQRRLARFDQAQDSREVVSHQLASIEDLLRLTHEQSIAIRDPEAVNRQLDALAAEAQATDETVREMERFIEFDQELSGPQLPHGPRVRT